MSYQKSLLAVGGVLEFLKNKVPVCSTMVDALLTAVQESQVCVSVCDTPSTTIMYTISIPHILFRAQQWRRHLPSWRVAMTLIG